MPLGVQMFDVGMSRVSVCDKGMWCLCVLAVLSVTCIFQIFISQVRNPELKPKLVPFSNSFLGKKMCLLSEITESAV